MPQSTKLIVAICIAAYKRPHLLKNTIKQIAKLNIPTPYKVVTIIVDNDQKGSSVNAINHDNLTTSNIRCFIEPVQGLSAVRNRLLDEAVKINAAFIAFIDDEFPHPDWLLHHLKTLHKYKVDIVSGPVIATDTENPPDIIKLATKYRTSYTPRYLGTGNVLLKSELITRGKLRFDLYYNFIGSEDQDFFYRAEKQGFTKAWCAEGIVYEIHQAQRKTLTHIFFRSFTNAICNVLFYKRRTGARLLSSWGYFILKLIGRTISSLLYILAYILTFNRIYLEKSITKFASAVGYISGLLNIVVERYRY